MTVGARAFAGFGALQDGAAAAAAAAESAADQLQLQRQQYQQWQEEQLKLQQQSWTPEQLAAYEQWQQYYAQCRADYAQYQSELGIESQPGALPAGMLANSFAQSDGAFGMQQWTAAYGAAAGAAGGPAGAGGAAAAGV